MHHNQTSKWRAYLFWSSLVSIVFFTLYPFCNWFSEQRGQAHHFYLNSELSIPLIPGFIAGYFSIYGLFFLPPFFLDENKITLLGKQIFTATVIAAIIFLIYPTTLGFTRVVPENSSYQVIFGYIFLFDKPYNMMPSLHVAYSTLIVLSLVYQGRSRLLEVLCSGWLVLICASTLLVHQHHLIDIVSGIVLAYLVRLSNQLSKRESFPKRVWRP